MIWSRKLLGRFNEVLWDFPRKRFIFCSRYLSKCSCSAYPGQMFGRFASFKICFPVYVFGVSSQMEGGETFDEQEVSFIFSILTPRLYAFTAAIARL